MTITASELIAAEVERQDRMWGVANERADVSKGQLAKAAEGHLHALRAKQAGNTYAFAIPVEPYPDTWSLRDYGSDIANLVIAAAFLHQEIKRKLAAGESYERTSRNPVVEPYVGPEQPYAIFP